MDTVSLIIGLITLLLLLVFVYYRLIVRVTRFTVNLLFVTGVIGVVSILFFSDLYYETSEKYLNNHSIGTELHSIDSTLVQAEEAWQYMNGIASFIGIGSKHQLDPKPVLFPAIATIISDFLILAILLVSFTFMAFGIYAKYTFTGYIDSLRLRRRVKVLEEKLKHISYKSPEKI